MKLQNTLNENKANDTINEDSSESALYQRLHDVSDVIERLYKEETITPLVMHFSCHKQCRIQSYKGLILRKLKVMIFEEHARASRR